MKTEFSIIPNKESKNTSPQTYGEHSTSWEFASRIVKYASPNNVSVYITSIFQCWNIIKLYQK